jgi:prepilin-type N-terminal cleavage/methylation domain-containing protein
MLICFKRGSIHPSRQLKIALKLVNAFTLAELLIALMILGIVAGFIIPKVLITCQQAKFVSVLKEDIATINAIQAEMMSSYPVGSGPSGVQQTNFYRDHLNAVKFCTPASNGNCWDPLQYRAWPYEWENTFPSVVFHNGSNMLSGFGHPGSTGGIIDANGAEGPNQFGVDQILIATNSRLDQTGIFAQGPNNAFVGVANYAFVPSDVASSIALWNRIFSN